MPRKQKTIHYLYKTTCDVTNRYYIGMHSTNDLDDGYMGSGKRLRYSIRKHGEDNHTKEILEFFDTRELLVEAEKNAITDGMIGDPMCMNLTEGGYGGNGARFLTKEQLTKGAKVTNEKLKELRLDSEWLETFKKNHSEGLKKAYRLGKRNTVPPSFEGKIHTEETKQKISEIKKGTGKGEANSQYGTCWITKDGENKKIKNSDLDSYLITGWVKGRKMK